MLATGLFVSATISLTFFSGFFWGGLVAWPWAVHVRRCWTIGLAGTARARGRHFARWLHRGFGEGVVQLADGRWGASSTRVFSGRQPRASNCEFKFGPHSTRASQGLRRRLEYGVVLPRANRAPPGNAVRSGWGAARDVRAGRGQIFKASRC